MQKIIKTYFKKYVQMTKQKQFNKKVALNSELSKFKKDNSIIVLPYDGSQHKILVKSVHVASMVNHATPENKTGINFNPSNFKLSFVDHG